MQSLTFFPFRSLIIAVKFPWHPPSMATETSVSVPSSMNTFIIEGHMPLGMYSYETMRIFTINR